MFDARARLQTVGVLTRSPYWDYTELEPIRIQFQVDRVSEAALRDHLEAQTEELRRSVRAGRRAYLIIAAQGELRPPPEVRKLQAEWIEEQRELIAQTSIGMGFVIDSPLVRGALTAIFWITRPPVPYKVHPTLAEALAHAVEACQAQALALPEEALRPDAAQRAELALARAMSRRIAL
jgi:hypothetical protein